MYIAIAIVHVLVCLFLIGVVLLQSGKAADLAGAFGGMGSQTVFGPRGAATVLTRATTISAIVFMITSLSLSLLTQSEAGTVGGSDVLNRISVEEKSDAKSDAKADDKSGTPAVPAVTPTPAAPAVTPSVTPEPAGKAK
jgi:preprotein translocase subunit SecG